jgi:D-glycero-D-manno-heptose 1,7-bisphosphate phosphatase
MLATDHFPQASTRMERSSATLLPLSTTAPEPPRAGHAPPRPAVLLDRDGVLNRDRGYVARVEDFEFLPGVFDALRTLARRGFRLVVVTNQSGIGRGYYGENNFQKLTRWMLDQLRAEGIELAGVYHCPHAPEAGCACRKPAPGLLLRAAGELRLDLGRSWLVGDQPSDIQAARAAGVGRAVLVRSGKPLAETRGADYVCDSLADVPELLKHPYKPDAQAREIL